MKKVILLLVLFASLSGCAGLARGCSSWGASALGADWIIVQFDQNGTPFNCWRLQNRSVANEPSSDGVYWTDLDGHLVHISGWYNRVQVSRGDWIGAANAVAVDLDSCTGGRYAVGEDAEPTDETP